jgi:hypothetical protein
VLETQSASESGSEVPVQGNLLAGGRIDHRDQAGPYHRDDLAIVD